MHRMSEVVAMESNVSMLEEDRADADQPSEPDQRAQLPPGVEAFQISGPLFFAVANRLDDVLDLYPTPPRVFILRMRHVPLIDASGVAALSQVISRCRRQGTKVILSGLREQPRRILAQMHVDDDGDGVRFARDFGEALSTAQAMPGEG
jgi:SulP family sulfate permease